METKKQTVNVQELESSDKNTRTFVVKDEDIEITVNIPFISEINIPRGDMPFVIKTDDNGVNIVFSFDDKTDINKVNIISKISNVSNEKYFNAIKTDKTGVNIFFPFNNKTSKKEKVKAFFDIPPSIQCQTFNQTFSKFPFVSNRTTVDMKRIGRECNISF